MEDTGYNKIEDYLMDRLSQEDRVAFEQQLQMDMNLAKKVDELRNVLALLNIAGDTELKREIVEVSNQFHNKQKPNALLRRLAPWIAAAAIASLVLFSYLFLKDPSPQQLYAQYYDAYSVSISTRDNTDSLGLQLALASQYYNQEEFSKAYEILREVPDLSSNARLLLMSGVCHLELNQFTEAINAFSTIEKINDPVYKYHSIWYKAMTHLKAGDLEKAKAELQQLSQAPGPNEVFKKTEATQLLKKL